MPQPIRFRPLLLMAICCCLVTPAIAQDSATANSANQSDPSAEVPAGHSYHGEFFNEGPRQKAYLMGGTGHVRFPVTTDSELAQEFVTQGVGQLYGFWYLEAERSFRQAAALDPDCAMAYWGAAQATLGNEKRSKGFIREAVERKDKVSDRERMYIDACDAYIQAGKQQQKKRAEQYTKALEEIALKYPDDVEAKAFLALQLYNNRRAGTPALSYLAVDALMQQIFAIEPMHSAHHFRIHLWDYKKPELALTSAALCGQGSPAIAHMWHMPGHIYSRLKRYDDACWQQEASARVDHAHMMRDRVMPDEIHNFAHNNEWLIRNLNHAGRVRDAFALAKNMIELPRHPKYNTLKKRGSAQYGRMRLFETLGRYELWQELITLCHSSYLEPTSEFKEQVRRLRHLGTAYFRSGDLKSGEATLDELRRRLKAEQQASEKAALDAAAKATEEAVDPQRMEKAQAEAEAQVKASGGDQEQLDKARAEAAEKSRDEQIAEKQKEIEKAKAEARKPFESKVGDLEKAVSEVSGHQAVAAGDYQAALPLLRKAGVDAIYLALVQHRAGETEAAVKAARAHVERHKNEVQPLAGLVELLWQAEQKEQAKQAFDRLREISSSIDMASPVFTRLGPIAQQLGYPQDWRVIQPPRDDVGQRPDLDSLGPFRWEPSPAPHWQLKDAEGHTHSLKQFAGRPVIVIFYLGYGCLHCAEQLQAFAPMAQQFADAGIALMAISSDDQAGLRVSIENYDEGKLPIPLVSNAELDAFQAYRAFDDFENQPLHGTFLIDGEGLVRWQDIGYEPFMDPKFLLQESQRLLASSQVSPLRSPASD